MFTIFVLLLLFVFQLLEKIASKKDSVTVVFLSVLQNFANFFIKHLRTVGSETVTEISPGNSAWNVKPHIIILVAV